MRSLPAARPLKESKHDESDQKYECDQKSDPSDHRIEISSEMEKSVEQSQLVGTQPTSFRLRNLFSASAILIIFFLLYNYYTLDRVWQ